MGISRRAPAAVAHAGYQHIEVDLGSPEQLEALADHTLQPVLKVWRWRRIGLVNNAAMFDALCPLESQSIADMSRLFAVNTIAPMFLMGVVARWARPTSVLRIVNISSGAAFRPSPGGSAYGASKAALRMAAQTLAAELASAERPGGPRNGFAILNYSPGVLDTPMQERLRQPERPWRGLFADFHARGQLLPPDAPANEVVRFLVSDGGPSVADARFEMPARP